MRLILYLLVTLLVTMMAGVVLIAPDAWAWGLLAWACASFLACLLFFQQRGHPWTLVVPALLLMALLFLKYLPRLG